MLRMQAWCNLAVRQLRWRGGLAWIVSLASQARLNADAEQFTIGAQPLVCVSCLP
jgi:hypothetical protein